jgi:hypothetical protein
MSIQDTFEFDKEGQVVKFPLFKRIFLGFVIVLIALLAFGIGRLSREGRGGSRDVKIEYDPSLIDATQTPVATSGLGEGRAAQTETASVINTGRIFASSQGKRYYYPGCKSTVSEKNKVFFADAKTAEAAGYTLATNCKPR